MNTIRFEIDTREPERALAFYSLVFGWQTERLGDDADHWLMIDESGSRADEEERAARLQSAAAARGALCFVDVSSLEAVVARVQLHGGRVENDRVDAEGLGLVVLCHDLDGHLFGLVERGGFSDQARTTVT
jgi:predicted enzyme related to lactoylglutathione lyase